MKKFSFAVIVLLMSFIGGAYGQSFINFVNAAVAVILPSYLQVGTGAMWSNVDASPPVIWNMSDRLFIGGAAYNIPDTSNFSANSSWLPNSASGATYLLRDGQFVSMATHGNTAVTGMSRSSDSTNRAAIGLGGFVISNRDSAAAWASYLECQLEPGTLRGCYGAEIDVKNKGANSIGTPFGMGVGGHGLWIAGGGDNSYGGVSANPSTASIAIVKNSNTWNTGILFAKDSITGCDGTGPACVGVGLAIGQQVCWYSSQSNKGCINGSSPDGAVVTMTLPASYTPPTSGQACSAGAMSWDASFVYICTTPNTWKRFALSTF